jgi:DNA-binding beta-propeller fold protein YncE
MKGSLRVGLGLGLLAICAGCGDTFRPIIIPNPPAFPDPRAAHTVVSINNNGSSNPGSIMVIDVSGDSNEGVANLGLVPVHAVQQTANQVLVVNQGSSGGFANSLMKVDFFGVAISGNPTTISLPADSGANFVATTESSQAYVLLPNYFDPIQMKVVPSFGVVNTLNNALFATVPVGVNPVAMAETPDGKKLYVVNQGDNSISSFNTLGRSPRTIDFNGFATPFNAPVWVSARSDSQRVYVLNGDGTLTSLDTTAQAGTTDKVVDAGLAVGRGDYMLYDVIRDRIYVPSGKQIAIVDVSHDPPTILGNNGNPIPIDTVAPALRNPRDVCFSSTPKDVTAVAVAALPDGSRAYVGSFYEDNATPPNLCPQVTVVNTSSNTVGAKIPVPGFPNYDTLCSTTRFRFTMAAGGDSSRIYLASCDAGNVNIINTANDTYLLNVTAPPSARPPIPPDTQPPPQNPVFLIAGP